MGPIRQNTGFLKAETILTVPTVTSPCLTFCIYCVRAQLQCNISGDSTHIWLDTASLLNGLGSSINFFKTIKYTLCAIPYVTVVWKSMSTSSIIYSLYSLLHFCTFFTKTVCTQCYMHYYYRCHAGHTETLWHTIAFGRFTSLYVAKTIESEMLPLGFELQQT